MMLKHPMKGRRPARPPYLKVTQSNNHTPRFMCHSAPTWLTLPRAHMQIGCLEKLLLHILRARLLERFCPHTVLPRSPAREFHMADVTHRHNCLCIRTHAHTAV